MLLLIVISFPAWAVNPTPDLLIFTGELNSILLVACKMTLLVALLIKLGGTYDVEVGISISTSEN